MNKFIRLLFLPLFIFGFSHFSFSQEIIASGGEHFENMEGSISWTIGKFIHETLSNNELILSQGFHQPEIIVNSIADFPELGLKLKAYPNPAENWMQLEFSEGFSQETFQVQLIDLFGRLHLEQELADPITKFDFSNLSSGAYLLRIQGNGQAVHTFKVVKP